MDRRTFLAAAGAAVVAPMMPMAAPVTETYATCPAGFALRSWSDGGRTFRAVVPVQRYGDEGGCRWTRHVKCKEPSPPPILTRPAIIPHKPVDLRNICYA